MAGAGRPPYLHVVAISGGKSSSLLLEISILHRLLYDIV